MDDNYIDIAVLNEINNKITPKKELEDLYLSIVEVSKSVLNAEECSLLLFDEKKNNLYFKETTDEKVRKIIGNSLPEKTGFAWDVVENKELFYSNDVKNDSRFYDGIDSQIGFITNNIICCPMKVSGEFIGVLEIVNSLGRDTFSKHDLNVTMVISEIAASSILNRLLLEELNKRVEELTALFELSKIALYVDDSSFFFKSVVEIISNCLNVERVSIVLYNENNDSLEVASSFGTDIPVGTVVRDDSVTAYVYKSRKPLFVNDPDTDIPDGVEINFKGYKNQSFISVPVLFNNECMGVLNLTDKKTRNYFDEFELQVLSTLGSQIAGVFQSYNLKIEEEKRKRFRQELSIASDIQKKNQSRIPREFGRVKIASHYEPAKEVGGDFFDFYKCKTCDCDSSIHENNFGIVVADVSGKGIPAALFTGTVKNILRAESRIACEPEDFFRNANNFIYTESEYGMFVTAFLANVNVDEHKIRYCCAGHNDQMIIRGNSNEVIKIKASGKPFGIIDDAEFISKSIDYDDGDILIMFTDGLVEALGGEEFDPDIGFDTLSEIILNNLDLDSEHLLNVIRNEIREVSQDSELFDDLTILIINL